MWPTKYWVASGWNPCASISRQVRISSEKKRELTFMELANKKNWHETFRDDDFCEMVRISELSWDMEKEVADETGS